jgi:exopolysaccharide biosynthesis polyprenyl glycosylphosphotransferase
MAINVAAGKVRSVRAPAKRELDWARAYANRLFVTDAAVIVAAVIGAQILRFGFEPSSVAWGEFANGFDLSYSMVSLLIIVSWLVVLQLFGTSGSRVIGTGSLEYKRVIDATIRLFGILAIVAFLLRIDLARSYIITSLPVGLGLLLFGRWAWRRWLVSRRAKGEFVARVLLVGSVESVVAIHRELGRSHDTGYLVVGACVPGDRFAEHLPGTDIPLSTNLEAIDATMREHDADTIVVTSSDELPPERIRRLSWSLEPGRQHLVLAPSLTDIGGPRIHMRPVAGLPLIHVETPRYEGLKRFSKRAFDVVVTGVLVVLLAPLLLVVAAAVRITTPGPVFFRQQRVGLKGTRFNMLKFRSMVTDAEAQLDVLKSRDELDGNAVMFKMKNDPRVTPIGRFLRRYSIDELPQLFNVLDGTMSLVGPRPPLDSEVQAYENHVHRRFMVKPGITGLWQVSGRSNLSWEDTVRLDLYYVENWSMTGDLVILWRTARAVLARDGAY